MGYADSLLAIEDGVELRAFTFESPHGGRASGVLAVPLAAGPHAGILNLTGFPVRPAPARAYAAELARRGAVVVLLWAPSARPDGAGEASPVTFTPADSAGQAQYVVDARRAVDVLLTRPDVDGDRLGLVGGSYGGAIGALVAGVEPRLRAVALRVPDGGFVSYFTDPEGPGLPEDVSPADATRWLVAMSAVEPACYVAEAQAPFLLQFGREDRLVSETRARALVDRIPSEKEVRWYEAGHALNDEAATDRNEWLDRTLGTSAPEPSGGSE
jgi:dienelactone hydrolase